VANRTHDRALCLAKELGGSAIYFDRLAEALYDADVVISATGAPHPIITYEKLKEAVPVETLGKMVMVDIANPRDIDERVAELGVRLYNIDDLRGIARENLQMRENEAKAAEAIIGEELVLLRRSLKHLEVEPLISSIRNQAEKMRIKETKKALRMMGDINGQEKVVDDLSRVVVDRIFSGIIKNIKIAAEKDDKSTLEVVERLFSNG
jgi:glutamyl-tRNA reductase